MRKMLSLVRLCLLSKLLSLKSHFFVFCADASKKLVTVWAKYLTAPDRSHLVLSKNGMIYRLWSYRSWNIVGRNKKNCRVDKEIPKSCINKGWNLAKSSSEPKNPWHFLKEVNKIFQMHLNISPKLWMIFAVISRKWKKNEPLVTF